MAEDTVDQVMQVLDQRGECRTKSLAIRGAAGHGVVEDEHLKNRYGGDATAVLALIAADPALGQPLVPGLPYLRAEAVYAASTRWSSLSTTSSPAGPGPACSPATPRHRLLRRSPI